MGRAITIRTDLGTAADLRRMAKQQNGRRTALRLLAIANAMEGMSRAQAARSAGIERQPRCDAIKRFNTEGIAGLVDRPKGHRRERLSEGEQAVLIYRIARGPDPDRGEPCAWTLPDLCRFIEARFDKSMCPQSMSRMVHRIWMGDVLGMSNYVKGLRQDARTERRMVGRVGPCGRRAQALSRDRLG